jgi:hypothetical protein
MAQKDAIIRNLEHTVEDKEREIELLKDALNNTGAPDMEKIRGLEQKIMEMQSLVKGLTEELLDLKTVVMKMQDERTPKEPKLPPVRIVTSAQKPAEKPRASVSPAPAQPRGVPAKAPASEEEMELIMQPDGTLKPEKKQSTGVIVAGKKPQKQPAVAPGGRGGRTAKARIETEEEENTPLIYADDDDTVEIKRKE